jgi:hypothetical protein
MWGIPCFPLSKYDEIGPLVKEIASLCEHDGKAVYLSIDTGPFRTINLI